MDEPAPIPSDLPSRIVFSLLRGSVKLAARMGLPLKQVVQLLRLAYYQELRESHPRDRKAVAKRLGISLRTAAELASQTKIGFTESEESVALSRQVRAHIDKTPRSTEELEALLGIDRVTITPVLETLSQNGWIEKVEDTWQLKGTMASYLGGSLPQKIDGLNRLQEVVSEAAWSSFFQDPQSLSTARTWVFHADPKEFESFRDASLRSLRTQTVELDEQSHTANTSHKVGVTVVFSRMTE